MDLSNPYLNYVVFSTPFHQAYAGKHPLKVSYSSFKVIEDEQKYNNNPSTSLPQPNTWKSYTHIVRGTLE